MQSVFVALIAALALACSAAPPETYAVQVSGTGHALDPAFSGEQAEVIRDARDAWCRSEWAFCPTEVAWDGAPDARVILVADYAAEGRKAGSMAWTNAARTEVRINPAAGTDLHRFWRVVAHEFGHLAGLEHGEGGLELMRSEPDPYGPLAIE